MLKAIKEAMREIARDRELWLWWLAGISSAATLLLAVQALTGSGLVSVMSWLGMMSAWAIALTMRLEQRAIAGENKAVVVEMPVDVVARVEQIERDAAPGNRWYRVTVGGEDLGYIEYVPAAHRSIRWNAHYPTPEPTSSAFSSKRRASASVARRAFC